MESLLADLRLGARTLIRQPAFTLVAVLSLALGTGVNTTLFSLVDAVLLRPLPVAHPEELAAVFTSDSKSYAYGPSSYPDYSDLRDRNDVFSGLVAHSLLMANLAREGRAEVVIGEMVTARYFDVLGVRPALGRGFQEEEDLTPDSHAVTVLSDGLWRRAFAADPAVVGRTVRLNGRSFEVIGVAPASFRGLVPGFSAALWVPTMMANTIDPVGMYDLVASPTGTHRLDKRGFRFLFLRGRLKPGIDGEQAQARMGTLMAQLAREHPQTDGDRTLTLLPAAKVRIHPMIDQAVTPVAALLAGVVGLVLLIACANVANMLLARAASRRKEVAIRLALGARRGRLVRQLLTESLLLALTGGAVGLLLAAWVTGLLRGMRLPIGLTLRPDLAVGLRVFGFAFTLSVAVGLLFGLAPALQATRSDVMPDLREEVSWRRAGRLRMGLRGALVVVQVALSLVLLVGATLLLRSLGVARSFDLGFRPEGVAFVGFDLGLHGYDRTKGKAFQDLMLERMRALPGVESAALSFQVPFDVSQQFIGIFPEGVSREPGGNPINVDAAPVGAGYFETMGVPIVEGRAFTGADAETTRGVAVVSQAFARRFWPGQEAVGKHIELARGGTVEVVGVSRDYRIRTIGEAPLPFLHLARAQRYEAGGHLLARTRGDAASLLALMRAELHALNPELALTQAKTMTEQLAMPLFPVRMGATILGGFGLFALFLASVGLYGVIAYSVSRRTREIAIRMAIGARREEVVRTVVREGMTLVAGGVALGLLLAAITTRLLTAVLYSVSPFDPMAFGLATSALVGAALLANAVPARRAASVDPVQALRHE